MVVIVFRSRLRPEAGDDYAQMAQEMYSTAKEIPGFVDFKSYKADDGERVSIVWWKDHETLAAWRKHPRHTHAQMMGRKEWYEFYKIEIADVVRTNAFEHKAAGAS